MVVLRSYFDAHKNIIINKNDYEIVETNKQEDSINGVGGLSDDDRLYGLYVEHGKLFFVNDRDTYELPIKNLYCSNKYISKTDRLFVIKSNSENICEIQYHPLVDSGAMYYDVDEEEFDVLLYLSSLLKDDETINKFVEGMKARQTII